MGRIHAQGIQVRPLTAGDQDGVADVLCEAFADSPNTLAVVRGDAARARRLATEGMRIAKLGRQHKNLWVAEYGGEIVGALNAVEWPHCQMGAGEKVRTALPMLRVIGGAAPRAMAVMSAWEKRDPRAAHWHFGPVGVRPDVQGQGIGTAMMAAVLRMIDDRHETAYLETDRAVNRPFYERLGFVVTGEENLLGVTNWYMWRDARPA